MTNAKEMETCFGQVQTPKIGVFLTGQGHSVQRDDKS